jgi:Alginate lyase
MNFLFRAQTTSIPESRGNDRQPGQLPGVRARGGSQLNLMSLVLGALVAVAMSATASAQIGGAGWTAKPLTFHVQWPYNVPKKTRYWFTNGIYHCMVQRNDAPFSPGNTTRPRTEQRFTPDYTHGEIQYQARLMAPADEDSYCIFQIHTGNAQCATHGSTTLMLFWMSRDGGSLHIYGKTEIARDLGSRWFQLNVDHDLVTRTIKVWVNRKLVWTQRDNGAGDFYMKDGVYEQNHHPTFRMDTHIADIHIWTCSGRVSKDVQRKDRHP